MSENRNDLSPLRALVKSVRIETPECVEGLRRFNLWRLGTMAGVPTCCLIDGESGTGKSTLLDLLFRSLRVERTAEGIYREGAYVRVPTKPTPIGLMEECLRALGDPRPQQGTRNTKMARLVDSILNQRVLFLFLDDLQHIVDRGSGNVIFDTSECLKEILEKVPCSVVCAGLPDAGKVVSANEQLQRRYSGPLHLSRFDWQAANSRLIFRGVLRGFRERLSAFELPKLESPQMALRIYLASGGIMDFVAKTIMWATWTALAENRTVVTLSDFESGWPMALWEHERATYRPFSESLDLSESELVNHLAHARTINQPVARPYLKVALPEIGL